MTASLPADLYHRAPCCACPACGGNGCYVLHADGGPDVAEHHVCASCDGDWLADLMRRAEADDEAAAERVTILPRRRADR